MQQKMRVGIFSLTGDEGCVMIFLEMLNYKYSDWLNWIDFVYCRQLKEKNEIKDLDLAIVEGAVSICEEEITLKYIRGNSKKMIAIGNCAINGMPSNQRNFFDEITMNEIQPVLDRFCHLKKVKAATEIVKFDEVIAGCPVTEEKFVEIIEKYLKEFKEKGAINA